MRPALAHRPALTAAIAGALLVLSAVGPVAAHTKVIQPPPFDEPVVAGPISNPWAQAHCNARSPEVVDDASNGVVRFAPGVALPCPAVPNPGGQVHGD